MRAKKEEDEKGRPPTFRIRKATMGDLPTLVYQRRAMWKAIGFRDKEDLDEADRTYGKWARTRMKNNTLMAWLAEDDETILGGGCLWLQPIQPMPGYSRMLQPYLLSMYTEPGSRGQGVATAIINAASEWARKNKFPQLRLHAAEMGRGVYSKQGFKRTWEMRLRLARPTRKNRASSRSRRV
jgi:GNAT superfamily N-acetyltransferase